VCADYHCSRLVSSRAKRDLDFQMGPFVSIAVLERDPSCSQSLRAHLESAGHRLSMFARWSALAAASEQTAFDAIVLDCDCEDSSDTKTLRHIRGLVGPGVPILMCSERCAEMSIVHALRAGADDYLVKPLRRAELIARLEAVARRRMWGPTQRATMQVGEFSVDCRQRTIHRDQVAIPLTSIDFDLSVLFLANIQQLLTREHIHEVIWKRAPVAGSRTLDTHVSRVRNRLKLLPAHGWRLVSIYGYGYRLQRVDPGLAAATQPLIERINAA
jgi:DNA-binding response OmpR family regulator